jgi:hypothetical protein
VSAPSIPGLLSLDPNSDPTNVLSNLTMGTEVEVQSTCPQLRSLHSITCHLACNDVPHEGMLGCAKSLVEQVRNNGGMSMVLKVHTTRSLTYLCYRSSLGAACRRQ